MPSVEGTKHAEAPRHHILHFVAVMLLLASLLGIRIDAIPASGTVIVRCGVSTTYGPSIAAGTQLILRDCYRANATNGTTVVVTITAATAAASSGLSIVVADSRRVAVQVYATANVSISHLSITVRNVTNDAAERTATSVVCSPSSCRPLVRINQVLHLVNASLSVADVTHVRNESAVYIEEITGSVSELALTVTNVSATSSVPVAGIDTVNGSLVACSVVVMGVVHTVTSITNPTVATVLLDGIAAIALTNVTIVDCALRGVTTSAGSAAVVGVQNSLMSDTSRIVVSNAQLQMTAALSACAAFVTRTTVDNSSVSIVNATAVRSPVAVLVLLLQNATTSGGAAFAVRSGSLDVISSSSAAPSIGIDILSSAAADSHFSVSDLTMTSTTPAAELFRVMYFPSAPRAGQLLRSNVSISNCSVSAAVGVVLFLYNVSVVSAVQVSLSDVAVTSQYPAILLYLLPVANSVSIVVLSSTLVAPNTIYFESSDISDLTTVVLLSTLKSTTTALFATPAYMLLVSSSTLRRSTVSFVATATGGVASGALAGHVVGVTSSKLLDGTRINAAVTTIATSGGVLQLYESVIANSSAIEVSVAGNITVPPSFPRSVVYVYSTTIAHSSTVRVVLPPDVGMASGSSQFAALYVDSASMSNSSLLELVGVATDATRIVWPNSALWLLSSTAANSSRIVLQGFHFVTIDVTVDVARILSCSVLSSQLTIANIAITTTTNMSDTSNGLAFRKCSMTNSIVAVSGVTCTSPASSVAFLRVCLRYDQVRLAGNTSNVVSGGGGGDCSSMSSLPIVTGGGLQSGGTSTSTWLLFNESLIDSSSISIEHVCMAVLAGSTINGTAPTLDVALCRITRSNFSGRIVVTFDDITLTGGDSGGVVSATLVALSSIDMRNNSSALASGPMASVTIRNSHVVDGAVVSFAQPQPPANNSSASASVVAVLLNLTLVNVTWSVTLPLSRNSSGAVPVAVSQLGSAAASISLTLAQTYWMGGVNTAAVVALTATTVSRMEFYNTTVVIPWSADVSGGTLLLLNSSSLTAATIEADALLLYGVSAFIRDDVNSIGLSSSVRTTWLLRCCWWARHTFTAVLDPLQVALHRRILYGPNSPLVVSPGIVVTTSPNSSSALTSDYCATLQARWSGSQMVGVAGGLPGRLAVAGISWTQTSSHPTPSSVPSVSSSVPPWSRSDSMSRSGHHLTASFNTFTSSLSLPRIVTETKHLAHTESRWTSTTTVTPQKVATLSSTPTSAGTHSISKTSSPTSLRGSHTRFSSAPSSTQWLQSMTSSRTGLLSTTRTATASLSQAMSELLLDATPTVLPSTSLSATVDPLSITQPLLPTVSHDVTSTHPTVQRTLTPTVRVTATMTHVVLPVELVLASAPVVEAAAFVSAVGAVVGGSSSVGEAATIATLSMLTCSGKRTWRSNTGPQRLVVSVFYDLGPGASLVGNLALAVATYAVQRALVGVVTLRNYRRGDADAAQTAASMLRYPSLSWALFVFLLPGVLFSAVSLLTAVDDALFGGDEQGGGRIAATIVGIVIGFGAAAMSVRSVAQTVWPIVHTEPTMEVFCVPNLPSWVVRVFQPWVLPRVMWQPKEMKLQWSSCFSSVASTGALWVHPLLQVHGAVFSLIAAVPFSRAACPAQFVLAMLWLCVPMGLILSWRMQLFCRLPSNVLSLLTNLFAFGVLLATCVYVEGPIDAQGDAAMARDVLGWMLTIVSATKTVLTFVSALIEKAAKRNKKRLERLKDSSIAVTATVTNGAGGLLDDRDHELHEWLTAGEGSGGAHIEDLLTMSQLLSDATIESASARDGGRSSAVSLPLRNESTPHGEAASRDDAQLIDPRGDDDDDDDNDRPAVMDTLRAARPALNLRMLDTRIEEVAEGALFTAARDARDLPTDQWSRLQRFTLKLLITRAARAAKV